MESEIWILFDLEDNGNDFSKKLPCLFNKTQLIVFNSYEKLTSAIKNYSFSIPPIIFTWKFFSYIKAFANFYKVNSEDHGCEFSMKQTTIDCGCKMKLLDEYILTANRVTSFEEKNEISRFNSEKLKRLNFNEREKDYLKHFIKGKNIDVVASKMNLSVKGVEYYRKTLYEKIGVKNKSELILFVVKSGVLTPLT